MSWPVLNGTRWHPSCQDSFQRYMLRNWWTVPRVHTLINGPAVCPSPCTFPSWHIYFKSHVSKCVIISTSNAAATRLETLLVLQFFLLLVFFFFAAQSCTFCALAVDFVYFCVFFLFFLVLFTLLFVFHSAVFFLYSIFIYSFIISSFVSSCGDKIKGVLLMFWEETV